MCGTFTGKGVQACAVDPGYYSTTKFLFCLMLLQVGNRVSQVLHISHPDILAHYTWCHLYFLLNVEQCQSKENISEYFPAHYILSAS
jgi:hypothetical protein